MCKFPEYSPGTAYQKGCKCDRCRQYKRDNKRKQRNDPSMKDRERKLDRERYRKDTKLILKNSLYRAHKKGYLEVLSPDEKQKIRELYEEARRLTEQTGIPHHVDHIMPLSKGGPHHPSNLQILTATENLKKGSMLPSEYMDRIQALDSKLQENCMSGLLNCLRGASGWDRI